MFWIKSMMLTIQMVGMVGLCGMSSDAEELADNFNLAERYDPELVSDFLSMETEEFEKSYDKNELYEKDILYCTEEAWRFQGIEMLLIYELDDITALRFTNVCPADAVIYEETILYNQYNLIRYFGDYAVSMYFQESRDEQSGEEKIKLIELSFVKITKTLDKSGREDVPPIEDIYRYQEYDYYEGWRELDQAEWNESPGGTKAVYMVNGFGNNAPSQIFVRYQEKIPDLIFREEAWRNYFVGWIDENHFICYNDACLILVHLERNQIEEIITVGQEEDFEPWGCQYEIRGDSLIATCYDVCYYWDIVREDGEVRLVLTERHDN